MGAVASAFTGRRRGRAQASESLGPELAAVSAEGVFEPSELVLPNED
jgi:hypothetical protein